MGLAILTMGMVYWVVNSYEQYETYGFDLKVKAVAVSYTHSEPTRPY